MCNRQAVLLLTMDGDMAWSGGASKPAMLRKQTAGCTVKRLEGVPQNLTTTLWVGSTTPGWHCAHLACGS